MEQNFRKQLGSRIRSARESAGLTQEELAEILKKGVSTIANYESGYRLPSLADTVEIANALGRPIYYLLDEREEAANEELQTIWHTLLPEFRQTFLENGKNLIELQKRPITGTYYMPEYMKEVIRRFAPPIDKPIELETHKKELLLWLKEIVQRMENEEGSEEGE